jgi:hypothetical protein
MAAGRIPWQTAFYPYNDAIFLEYTHTIISCLSTLIGDQCGDFIDIELQAIKNTWDLEEKIPVMLWLSYQCGGYDDGS